MAGGSRTPTIVPFTFRARTDELPTDLTACVAATYSVQSGEPRRSTVTQLSPPWARQHGAEARRLRLLGARLAAP